MREPWGAGQFRKDLLHTITCINSVNSKFSVEWKDHFSKSVMEGRHTSILANNMHHFTREVSTSVTNYVNFFQSRHASEASQDLIATLDRIEKAFRTLSDAFCVTNPSSFQITGKSGEVEVAFEKHSPTIELAFGSIDQYLKKLSIEAGYRANSVVTLVPEIDYYKKLLALSLIQRSDWKKEKVSTIQ